MRRIGSGRRWFIHFHFFVSVSSSFFAINPQAGKHIIYIYINVYIDTGMGG